MEAKKWSDEHQEDHRTFHILYQSLPPKHAGVGLARKIGMDEAIYRFEKIKNKAGIIVCFDADAQCDANYLVAIEQHFQAHPTTVAASIYFEHPLEGNDFNSTQYQAITDYELHLRYYTHAQKYAGFPYAYETIGSSMAVRSMAYQQQGGMNKRKAGEDFYFIHKFTTLGLFSEIKNTRVIPSARVSTRVPFGTGKAVAKIVEEGIKQTSYAPESFQVLQPFFNGIGDLYGSNKVVQDDFISAQHVGIISFLEMIEFKEKLNSILSNTSTKAAFIKRFFHWFNAFMVMKYVHHMRDQHFPNIPVAKAAAWLLETCYDQKKKDTSAKELLLFFRSIDQRED